MISQFFVSTQPGFEEELTDDQRELLELESHYGDDEGVYRHTAGQHRRAAGEE